MKTVLKVALLSLALIAGAAGAQDKAVAKPQGEQVTWQQLEPIAAYWAGAFRQRLDELRGVKPQ